MKKQNDEGFFQLLHDYLNIYLPDQKHTSPNTIKSYRELINLFLDYISVVKRIPLVQLSFSKINSMIVLDFLDWLEKERNCCIATRNQRLAGIRSFYKYASIIDYSLMSYRNELMKIPIKKNEAVTQTMKYMSEEAVQTILRQPDTSTKKGIRDQFFMILMYDTGARNREILDLHLQDFDTASKTPCIHVTGKGNKKRTIPVMTKTVEHFKQYCLLFHANRQLESYLFYTSIHGTSQQMSDDNVSRFMNYYSKKAHVECYDVPEHITPHMWRHSRSIHLYRAGMPLPLLSEWLGHAQLETTQIYAYADTEMKRVAIDSATGASNPMKKSEIPCWKEADSNEMIKKLYRLL